MAAVVTRLVMIAWSDVMCLQFIGLGYLSEKLFICRGTVVTKWPLMCGFASLYFKYLFCMDHSINLLF